MFEILFENKSGVREYVHQNSWGISTRTIGITVMVHGDNQGMCFALAEYLTRYL